MKSIYVRMTETTKKGTKNNEETRETRDERRESSTIVCHDGLTRCSVLHCMLTTANGITEFAAVNTILLLLFVRKLSHVFSLSIRIVHVFSCANSRKKNYEKKNDPEPAQHSSRKVREKCAKMKIISEKTTSRRTRMQKGRGRGREREREREQGQNTCLPRSRASVPKHIHTAIFHFRNFIFIFCFLFFHSFVFFFFPFHVFTNCRRRRR